MKTTGPLPVSEGAAIYAELDRRPPRTLTAISLAKGEHAFHYMVEALDGGSVRVFELVVHRRSRVPDVRCIVARFRDLDDLKDAIPVLAEGWLRCYGEPPSDHRSFTPCPN